MVPWAHPSAHPKWYLDRFIRFRRAAEYGRFNSIHQLVLVCTIMKNIGSTRVHNPNGIWISSAIFAQLTAMCRGHAPARSFP